MGAMLALMLAAASPAFAQAVVADDGDDGNLSVQVVDASQFQSAVQIQAGDANAAADDGSLAVADQSLFINQYQVNGGLGGIFFAY